MSNLVKKFFVVSLMFVTTMLYMAPVMVPTAHALAAGDLIKGPNSEAVYYIGADNKKYVFPDAKTYFTWYKNFNGIKKVTVNDLDLYAAGGAVTYRPGTKMVKTVDSNKVYAVSPGGVMNWIKTEDAAKALWGNDWAKRVNDVIPGYFFATYTVGADLGSTFPTGSLIQKTGDSTIYYVDGTTIRPFASGDAFTVNSFDYAFVVKVASLTGYSTGSSITGQESALSSINASSNVPQIGGSVTVSLASDTPATGMVLGSAARYPFTKVNFTNNSSVDVTVDQAVVKRLGIASDGAFTDLDLLRASDSQPLNDYSKSLGSEHTATFNDDWTIPANSTLGVIIAGNMAANTSSASGLASYAGEVPVLALQSVTLKGGATLTGSLPISGNYQNLNGTILIGTATVVAGGQNPSAATKEVGTTNYIVSSFKVTAGGQEDLTIKSVTLTNNGSTSASDIKNLKLVNANTNATIATMATVATKKVTFSNINYTLGKGKNVTFDVRLDIDSGSGRDISMDIDMQGDLVVSGNSYNTNILPTFTGVSSSPYFNAAQTTVGNGTLRVESLAISPTNISEGLTQVALGSFKFVAKGEPMNITSIGWNFVLTTTSASADFTDITNVTVYGPSGAVVAGPKDFTAITYTGAGMKNTATTTDTISVPVGESTYTVKADLSSDFTASDTIKVGVEAGAIVNKGETTGNTISVLPAATNVQSSTMTVKAASLAVTTDTTPAAQTVVAGSQDFTVAQYVLSAVNSGTDIEVTSISPTYKTTGAAYPNILSGFTLWSGATEIGINSDSTTCSGATCSTAATNATTTLTLNDNALIIPKGTSKVVTLKADIGTGATSGTFLVALNNTSASVVGSIAAVDSEAQAITPTVTNANGQAMQLTTGGTLNVSIASDPKASNYIAGSTVEIGRVTIQPKYEGVTYNYLGFTLASPSGGIAGNYEDISSLSLWDGSTKLGEVSLSSANATITPTNMKQAVNEEKTYVVKATFTGVGSPSAAASGEGVKVSLTNIDANGTSAGSSALTVSGIGTTFNDVAIFKSLPTVTKIDFAGSGTITGNDTINLYKFSVAADSAGPVGLYRFTFGVSTTTVYLSTTGYYLYESSSSSSLGDLVSKGADFSLVTNTGAGTITMRSYFDVNDDSDPTVGEHIVIGAGTTRYFTLRGTVSSGHDGTADNESISVVMAGDHAYAATSQKHAQGVYTTTDLGDFIWSDLNFDLYSTTTATNNVGWYNGFRVPGLDTTSSTAQVVGD
ncbi:MAG: hypothetical protein V1846_04935 [Candidatus Komeilibacteria bacterium]